MSVNVNLIADFLSNVGSATVTEISAATGIRVENALLILSKNPDYFLRTGDKKPRRWILKAMPEGERGFVRVGNYCFPLPLETGVSGEDLEYLAGCFDQARKRGWTFKPARYCGGRPRIAG